MVLVGAGYRKTAARSYKSAPEVKEHGERAAEQLLERAFSALRTDEAAIASWPRGDRRKVLLAALLRQRTTVSNGWIAERLKMASAANVSQRVRMANSSQLVKRLPPSERKRMVEIFAF